MLKYLLEKEFKRIARNTFMPRLIVIFPCLLLLLFPWAATMEVTDVRVEVVDNDGSVPSRRLAERMDASAYFIVTGHGQSYAQALAEVEAGRADMIVEIPRGYASSLAGGDSPSLSITANATDGMKGALGASYMTSLIMGDTGAVSVVYKYNPYLDYKLFMVPALISIMLVLVCGFLPCLNIVGEKETGTIEQMNVSPVPRVVFILSKLIPYWLIGLVELTIGMALAWLVYGIVPAGSAAMIYLASVIFIFLISGMGLIISNYSATMQQSMFVMFFFILVLILMSGLFTPIASMPGWAQAVTMFNPFRYFIEVMRTVYMKGPAFAYLLPNLLVMMSFAAAFYGWAIVSYRKRN